MFHVPPPRTLTKLPTGIAFEVSDLLLAEAWAEYHALRMVIELDSCTDGDEYEEMLAFYPRNSAFRRWMIWRSAAGIVVQPMMARSRRHATVAEALEQMIPAAA
jgi:hypothetical protein